MSISPCFVSSPWRLFDLLGQQEEVCARAISAVHHEALELRMELAAKGLDLLVKLSRSPRLVAQLPVVSTLEFCGSSPLRLRPVEAFYQALKTDLSFDSVMISPLPISLALYRDRVRWNFPAFFFPSFLFFFSFVGKPRR